MSDVWHVCDACYKEDLLVVHIMEHTAQHTMHAVLLHVTRKQVPPSRLRLPVSSVDAK